MAKIDLDALSIEELASLRDHATEKLAEKVVARQAELEAELERLSQYGKPARKSQGRADAKLEAKADAKFEAKSDAKSETTSDASAAPKARKNDEKKGDEAKEPAAKAA
jgi:hypothetical protein